MFAAASLQEAVKELTSRYQAAHPKVRVVASFAGSNALARQLASAPGADVFFSADEAWMDFLDEKRLLIPGTRRALLTGELVVVARSDGAARVKVPADLAGASYGELILADPDAVPAGRYAKAWLEREGLWVGVKERVVPALDVRAALAAVAADPRRVGIVYGSDLRANARLRALYVVPASSGPAIRYPIALIAGRPNPAEARALLEYLESGEAAAVYRAHGFGMLER